MGFYGNITNTSKIQFVFDKTYQNRKQMEENMATDNIYVGRYVLVDYDLNFPDQKHTRLYKYNNTQFYFSPGYESKTRARSSSLPYYLKDEEDNIIGINDAELDDYTLFDGQPIYIWDEDKQIETYYSADYKEGSDYPIFTLIDPPAGTMASTNFYYGNYMIDKEAYGDASIGRGWDSTVWQKVYTNNEEKYVIIAELNSVVPTFDLAIDQPTLNPMRPHFDSDSSNLYYRLHVQPNWGFRVANYDNLNDDDKEIYGSDIIVKNEGWNYNTDRKTMQKSTQQYNGAIYFNKDGFDPDYKKIKETSKDEISVKMTGSTGMKYQDRHGSSMNSNIGYTRNDIQELFINLPSVGNAVSTLWDAIYGEGIETPEEGVYRRNPSMDWDTYAGERLIKESDSGTGYEFTPEKVASIAGAVNSVHDLMGMIIIEDDKIPVENALLDHIYYRTKEDSTDKGFFIKDLSYDYEESDAIEKQEEVELKEFSNQKYYYKKKNNYYLADEYQNGAQYFILPDAIEEQLITEYEYKPNTYYYQDVTNSFILAGEETPRQSRSYYYVPEWDGQNIPVVDNELVFFYPTDQTYYNNFFKGTYNSETKIGSGLFTQGKNDNGETILIPFDFENDNREIKNLYWWTDYKITTEIDTNGKEVEVYDQDNASTNSQEYTMIPFQANKYFSLKVTDSGETNYILLKNQAAISKTQYYTFPEDQEPIKITGKLNGSSKYTYFYEPNKYYYIEGGNYVFAEEIIRLNKTYYNLNEEQIILATDKFYEPNKYYYKIGENVYLDINEKMTEGRQYYNIYRQYVIDGAGIYQKGEKWNPSVDKPNEVKLGLRHEKYIWKELKGFARQLNTIHGLILKINQILKCNDKLTRDTSTVQGCINSLNDIINRFDNLVPNQLAIINQYGKITSGPSSGDNWININTNNGKIQLNHIGPVSKEIVESDKPKDVTPKFGESFTVIDNYFDDKGHKYNAISHTVTIPKGSLSDTATNGLDVITQLTFNDATGALSTTRSNITDIKISTDETLGKKLENIDTNIANEIINRETAITNEADERKKSDTALDNKISQEISNRENVDTELDTRISSLENKTISWNDIQEKPENFVLSDTTFTYNSSSKTIQELFNYIFTLENRIVTLENNFNSKEEEATE